MTILKAASAVAAIIIAGAACTSMSVKTEVTKSADCMKAAGKSDPARVEVFEGAAPDSPFTELAVIKATGRRDVDQGELVKAMRERAARLGADAIIDVKFSELLKPGGAGGDMVCPFEGACYYQQSSSTIIGMPAAESRAIRYDE
ncbi:MAG: hypothetical protein JXA24_02965 [Proteobacteria bacterium]|nr:hypothetical protein [Pseudomonadota bacterium]